MKPRLRIFVSSPGDVKAAREIAALTIERLAQDYARFFTIEPYLWEFEAMVASGHFEDSIEPPSAFDVVVLIVWSRLGTSLPERTGVREYRGIDGRTPVTGTEWEFEEALHAAQKSGAPDLLVYRSRKPAPFDTRDPNRFEEQLQQLKALNGFWERHFANQGLFIGAYTSFTSDAEFAVALEHHLRKLIERRIAARGATPSDMATQAWAQAPFRGLEAYEFEHAPIFFGQDEALAKAMLQLTGNAEAGSPFLLVLGASGSGKSSLVKAGILPKLFVPRRIPGTAFLRRVVFRPSDAGEGEDLFDALARRLATQVSEQEGVSELIGPGQSAAMLAAHLRNATVEPAYPIGTALGELTTQARQSGRMLEYETAKLVLVVDQLEELFTSDRVPLGERLRFVELLASLVRSGLVWVLATMRKDFWHRADETPELVRLSEGNGRLELLPPGPAQLSQMIRRPAEAAGVSFEVHDTTNVPLNEVISEEVAREPGALPLLSYLLDQLYRNDVLEAHGHTLTYATYESLGRLEGAIATKAEAVLERCAPEDRQAFGSVLFFLVETGTPEGDVDRAIARRVPLSTFPLGTPQRRLVEALLDPDARLLVSDAEKEGNPTVRVAHEALISRWAQAREFVQRNAEALRIRHRIEERYGLWCGLEEGGQEAIHRETGRTPSLAAKLAAWRSRFGREHGLLSDIDLTDGRRLLKEHRTDTEPHLIAYIERSISDDKRIRTRSFRVLSTVAIVVTLLAVVSIIAGLIAAQQRDRALEEAKRANAQADLTQYILDDKVSKLSPGEESQRLHRARQFLAARFRNEPLLAARLLIDVSGRYIDIGEFRTAAEVAVEAETIGHRFDDADILGQLACIRTEDLAIARDFTAARAQLAQGLAQMRRLNPMPPGIEAECALAESFVVQADGDFARAIDRLRTTVADLDRAGMHGAARYLATSNDLARALAIAGQYHEAWEVSSRNVALVTETGRADTNAYLAYVNGVCSALRNGGQPTRAVAYIDANTARVRHDAGYLDMGVGSESCWALSRLDRGEAQQAEPAILEAARKAEQGGVTYQAALLRSSAVIAALARGDLATAEVRWAELLPDEEHRLAANEKGIEVVRLLLVSARLDVARHRPDEALKSLERAEALIASRRQRTNPDARELEALRSAALMAKQRYVEAEQHAQAALELARISAVDPKSSSWIGEALVLRARAEAAAGRKAASATAQEALTHLVANLDPSHPLIAQAREIASSLAP